MFLQVHAKDSGKEAYINFDYVMSIVQEKDRTVLIVNGNKGTNEITEKAEDIVKLVNRCSVVAL